MEALGAKKIIETGALQAKTVKIESACLRYGLGKNTMRKVAAEAGAVVRIGKSYLINISKVDSYMDEQAGE